MHRIWMVLDPRRTLIALFALLFTLAIVIHGVLLTTDRYNWLAGGRAAAAPVGTVSPPAPAPAPEPAAAPAPTAATPTSVYFDVNAAAPDSAGQRAIADAAATLRAQPSARIAITGYTDATGNLAANQELAKNRAKAVRDALVAAGVPLARIDMRPPASVQANAAGGAREARRVDLTPLAP
ncbi:hypothetical protein tb265_02780 [Gemmatimonadetes bacterium T265]|nr:hypothetical protein tb265_02780 [Gemmatimonadetes bacterium T265]